ncbi:uncharacterized protein [Spinacia oleracea]|uniref:Uncharacterized protein n=1 Tax=Spinacia oleracea TaxID=3562 RepID=A0ABM3R759_SPIOL|nr:uncharacterized protein LOC130466909 [Spinacia oleracea]
MRVLFVGRWDPVWYLGERVRMQTVGVFSVPRPPPATMLSTRSIGESWRVHSRTSVPATELVIEGASYYQFIQDSLRLPEPGAEGPDPLLGGMGASRCSDLVYRRKWIRDCGDFPGRPGFPCSAP